MRNLSEPLELHGPLWPEMLDRQLEMPPRGLHMCPFYRTPAERLHVLVTYFGGGLARGEQCLYFADADRANELAQALRPLGAGAQAELDRGALVLVTSREEFMRNGLFDPRTMLDLQDSVAKQARSSGFSALRIAGEANWELGGDLGTERLLEYEALLNRTLPANGSSGVCLYDWERTQPNVIRDVLRTHQVVIIQNRVHQNLYYEPADMVLGGADVERIRMDWRLRLLQSHTRRVTALFDLGRLSLEGASPADIMRAAPALIADELQLDYVELFELLPSGDAVRLVGSHGSGQAAVGSVERLDSDSLFADAALRAGQPVIVTNWQAETRLKQPAAVRDEPVTSSVGIVLSVGHGEHVTGFLSAHSREARLFSDDEVLFLDTVGTLLAYAINSARTARSFQTLVEQAPDVIVRLDGELRVIYANPAIERVTASSADSLIGKTSYGLGILEALVPTWELLLRRVWRSGREEAFELTLRTATGDRIFDSRIIPEFGGDGSMQSLLTISRDVTEQRRAETARSALYQQLLAQQNRVQELAGRLAQVNERPVERISSASQLERLNERERRILRLLAGGRTNREIGAELGLSVGTIKNQVARLLSKLNVSDRTQAAVRAVELGLVGETL